MYTWLYSPCRLLMCFNFIIIVFAFPSRRRRSRRRQRRVSVFVSTLSNMILINNEIIAPSVQHNDVYCVSCESLMNKLRRELIKLRDIDDTIHTTTFTGYIQIRGRERHTFTRSHHLLFFFFLYLFPTPNTRLFRLSLLFFFCFFFALPFLS